MAGRSQLDFELWAAGLDLPELVRACEDIAAWPVHRPGDQNLLDSKAQASSLLDDLDGPEPHPELARAFVRRTVISRQGQLNDHFLVLRGMDNA